MCGEGPQRSRCARASRRSDVVNVKEFVVPILESMLATNTPCRPRESGDPVNTERPDGLRHRDSGSGILGPRFRGDDRKKRRDDRTWWRSAAIALAAIA